MTPETRSGSDEHDLLLIGRWKAGDSRAAEALVARHADALARFAASAAEWNDVEELVQDTFVKAFGSLDSFRGESSFRTWLFTIERRLMLDRRRSELRERRLVPMEGMDHQTGYDQLDELIARETESQVQKAMQSLSKTQREVFVMRAGQGLSYREIAAIAGTTEGAARVHYHNAIRVVKELLDD